MLVTSHPHLLNIILQVEMQIGGQYQSPLRSHQDGLQTGEHVCALNRGFIAQDNNRETMLQVVHGNQ